MCLAAPRSIPILLAFLFVANLSAITYNCTTFGSPAGTPTGINNDGFTVGASGTHAFFRDSAGNVTLVDYPGAPSTRFYTINNLGIAVGSWGQEMGQPGTFGYFTYDTKQAAFHAMAFPAPYDSDNVIKKIFGINDAGAISVGASSPGSGFTFFILNPDGSATLLPSGDGATTPASLNTANSVIENRADQTQFAAYLAKPGATATSIVWSNYPQAFTTNASGINNHGDIVGFVGLYHAAPNVPPSAGFTLDASGVFSEVVCNDGLFALSIAPAAINDNGVIAGGSSSPDPSHPAGFIATPQPGLAQYSSSAASIDMGTVFVNVFQSSMAPPQSFTIANNGNARLDFASVRLLGYPCCSGSDFQVSACISQGVAVSGLGPGASCVLTVTVSPHVSHLGTITDEILIDDSAPGAPHVVPVSMNAVTNPYPPIPPACQVSTLNPGPPRTLNFTAQDTNSGLQSITVLSSTNVNPQIPSYQTGTTSPVSFAVTQLDEAQLSTVSFQIAGVSGFTTTCGATIYGGANQWTSLGASIQGTPVITYQWDNRLAAFARTSDNTLWYKSQISPGSTGWTDWQNLGGAIVSDPAVGYDVEGRLEVFAAGTDGALWHIEQTNVQSLSQWSAWATLGGAVSGNPAVTSDATSALEIFTRGSDGSLSSIVHTVGGNPAWSAWQNFGGYLLSDPTLSFDANGHIVVFARGGDNALWYITESSPGMADPAGWLSLGGYFSGNPAPVSRFTENMDVFVRGGDNAIWHIAQSADGSGVWGAWTSLGGYLTSDPAVGTNDSHTLDVFAQGGDGALWHIAETAAGGSWASWSTLNGIILGGASVARDIVDERLEVIAQAPDHSLWHIAQVYPGSWN